MIISVNLPEFQVEQLNKEADKLGIKSDELARAAITDIISLPNEEIENVVEDVLKKNTELYNRLK
jgi:hypothetical protein